MKQDVRTHILATGADLVHRQGFNNTGIQEILKVAGVPKGSFYFYFKNKEDFGLNLVDFYYEQFAVTVRPILQNKSVPPLQRMRNFFKVFHDYFEQHDYTRGCPIGNLAQELGDLSPAFGTKLSCSIDSMASVFKPLLDEAVADGELSLPFSTTETAFFIVSAWQGSLLRMKVAKSPAPLELFEQMVFEDLLA